MIATIAAIAIPGAILAVLIFAAGAWLGSRSARARHARNQARAVAAAARAVAEWATPENLDSARRRQAGGPRDWLVRAIVAERIHRSMATEDR